MQNSEICMILPLSCMKLHDMFKEATAGVSGGSRELGERVLVRERQGLKVQVGVQVQVTW